MSSAVMDGVVTENRFTHDATNVILQEVRDVLGGSHPQSEIHFGVGISDASPISVRHVSTNADKRKLVHAKHTYSRTMWRNLFLALHMLEIITQDHYGALMVIRSDQAVLPEWIISPRALEENCISKIIEALHLIDEAFQKMNVYEEE